MKQNNYRATEQTKKTQKIAPKKCTGNVRDMLGGGCGLLKVKLELK